MSLGRLTLRHITRTFVRLRGLILPPGTEVSKIDIPYPPLFESVPPASFRYAIPLAISLGAFMCVLIVSGSAANDLMSIHTQRIGACDLALNHWSRLEKPLPGRPAASPSSKDDTLNSPASESEENTWVLRPLWQRATLAGVYVTVSLSFGVMFFGGRARYVHRLHIMGPLESLQGTGSAKGRTLFFQTCDNGRMHGRVVPLRQCKIMLAARDWTLVFLEAKGTPGVFRIGTAGAKIKGKETPPSEVFAELAKRGIPNQRLDTKKR